MSNPDRAPATATGNGVNMGIFALVLVWVYAKIDAWIPVDIDPASGLPIDSDAQSQQALAMILTAAAAAVVGFVSNIIKNISTGLGTESLDKRIASWVVARLP
jgi:hypothetical protein